MPQGPYAASKWRAEQGLSRIADRTGLELVIVRPSLMYGPGVKANLLALLKLVAKPYLLPFGGASNLRSLLYVDNLASFLLSCVESPSLVREVFLLSDCDLSTRDLVFHLRKGLGRPSRLVNVPAPFIRMACAITGQKGIYTRLFGSLLIDSSKAKRLLDWVPPYTPEEGFAATARWFASCQG
jgi:nucleoside-diphosphate-sugar epimerase